MRAETLVCHAVGTPRRARSLRSEASRGVSLREFLLEDKPALSTAEWVGMTSF